MAELVAVTYLPPFKHHLLMFDRIACPWLKAFTEIGNGTQVAADLAWLQSRNVVFTPQSVRSDRDPTRYQNGRRLVSGLIAAAEDGRGANRNTTLEYAARAMAARLREKDRLNAVPLVTGWTSKPGEPASRADVIQLVIKELPIPADTHSLEDILHFRDEARSLGLIQSLRVWTNEIASGTLTELEASDKLDDLVSRYDRALKMEKMSRDRGVVETLAVTTAEIAESLVRFKWSTIAKKLFEVRHKQIDLMKAEMDLPGREVAYIVQARERFGK